MNWLRRHKHSLLMATMVLALISQPVAGIAVEIIAVFVMLSVFLVVFERRWEQVVGLIVGVPCVVLSGLLRVLPESSQFVPMVAYQALMVIFLAFAIVRILADIFQSHEIGLDHVIGGFCGFILVGLVWAKVYLLIEYLVPGSFHIDPQVAVHLQDVQLRRFLFNHFSFAMLTPMDTGGVTPARPLVRTLTWIEALFGQFYFAVFIGQLVAGNLGRTERLKTGAKKTQEDA
jgi:hypothetical protein